MMEVRPSGSAGGSQHSSRQRTSRSLNNAASSIVANTPRGTPSSAIDTTLASKPHAKGSISGPMAASYMSSGSTGKRNASVTESDGSRYTGVMSDFDVSMMNGSA